MNKVHARRGKTALESGPEFVIARLAEAVARLKGDARKAGSTGRTKDGSNRDP